jgi:hypothetical protein
LALKLNMIERRKEREIALSRPPLIRSAVERFTPRLLRSWAIAQSGA